MTGLYVRSNVQSLVSQTQLQRNMADLSNILTRLSTGLRINSGKDDPAGLIASELLKSDITGTNKAISNAQRANSIIGIADSALGQVSNLLNDIKGLVVEASNSGAMTAEQIAANQLQVDASLDSIDRISKTVNYQGKLLLDGSMDFQTQGVSSAAVRDLQIHQANFGTADEIGVDIQVQRAASRAKLFFDRGGTSEAVVLEVGGNLGSDVFKFAAGTDVKTMAEAINRASDSTGVRAVVGQDATAGQIMLTSAGFDNDINLTSLLTGSAAGNYTVKFTAGDYDKTTYTITEPSGNQPGIIEFKLKMAGGGTAGVTGLDERYNGVYSYDLSGGTGADANSLVVQSDNGTQVTQVEFVAMAGNGTAAATYDKSTGKLQIHYGANATNVDFQNAVNAISGLKYVSGGITAANAVPGTVNPTDLRANNALDINAAVPGSKFENTDIVYVKGAALGVNYSDTAQAAALSLTKGANSFRVVGKTTGANLNDVKVIFEPSTTGFGAGEVSAVYDENAKVLHIQGDVANASVGAIKSAIESASPFRVDTDVTLTDTFGALTTWTGLAVDSGTAYSAFTGTNAADIGTDHQTLFITTNGTTTTAQDIVDMFNGTRVPPLTDAEARIVANFVVSNAANNNGSGTIFNATLDTTVNTRLFSAALQGGSDGYTTDVTAKELVDFINNDAVLSSMFHADVALGQTGNGKVTLFDEAAYYGDIWAETALQFLGLKNSPDILFVTDGKNQQLGLSFSPYADPTCTTDDRPVASVQAKNANASFTVQAKNGGDEYNNMAVRLIRLDNNHAAGTSYAQYVSGPSNAMAYCSIDNTVQAGTATEKGKFIVYGAQGGEQLNNVSIVAKLDTNQTDAPAKAYYDEATKQLIVTVNSANVTLSEAMDAINATGLFTTEFDFSYNNTAATSNGPGNVTFANAFAAGNSVVIGNTGETGGYNGVLEVYVAGDDTEITAQEAINAINNSPTTAGLFTATALGNGTGTLSFRDDNLKTTTGSCGEAVTVPNGVSGILGTTSDHPGYMIVHLATDEFGNSTTTARELVEFFNQLTAEQTKGISVSLVRPPGVDNLLRTWEYDNCGNVIMTQECDDDWGKGILQPTYEKDDCDNYIFYPIEFYSYGENIQPGNAHGSVIAANGINASLEIYAKDKGPDANGIGFKYVRVTDRDQMKAEYDEANREIIVYVMDGTTANEVKSLIETSDQTKKLFTVSLPGDGTGIVTVSDDFLLLKGGTYDAGYRGGAKMLGAGDEDPNKLTFESVEEGSDQRVTVRVKEGNMELKDENGKVVDTAYGHDMEATINGMKASARGRALSIDTSTLKMDITLDERVQAGDSLRFAITGGGALFQIGPDVVSNQQIRIGLGSVNSASLGGASGRLYQLRKGGTADLITDDASRKMADKIVSEAIVSIAQLRGRLGAIQKCTLEPTIASLQDQLEALTSAEAQISNADFAEESSRLTRAQILVQAGSITLQIANQFPQYAASLLGG